VLRRAVLSRSDATGDRLSETGEDRWRVGLWSDSAGDVTLEVPNEWVEYYGHTQEVGDQMQLLDNSRRLKGNFSALSNSLAVDIPATGFFDGTCKRLEH